MLPLQFSGKTRSWSDQSQWGDVQEQVLGGTGAWEDTEGHWEPREISHGAEETITGTCKACPTLWNYVTHQMFTVADTMLLARKWMPNSCQFIPQHAHFLRIQVSLDFEMFTVVLLSFKVDVGLIKQTRESWFV